MSYARHKGAIKMPFSAKLGYNPSSRPQRYRDGARKG